MTLEHPYRGRQAGLATRHGKGALIVPVLARIIGLEVVDIDVDTDRLGTFTGEIPRFGTPAETAITKARLGMEKSGMALGLANEGTIGPHPAVPFAIADVEIVVLVDDELGTTVSESETEFGLPTLCIDVEADRWEGIAFESAGFPEHALIVRPSAGGKPIFKGIHELDELRNAIHECAHRGKTIRIESDLRAHHHPSRQRVIARAAERLAHRLTCLCPRCGTPGWGVARREPGAPCSQCGRRTGHEKCEHFSCPRCDFIEIRDVAPADGVDPRHCPRCNP